MAAAAAVISGGGGGEEEEERLLARGLGEDAVTCKLWALGRAARIICTDFRFSLQSARGIGIE